MGGSINIIHRDCDKSLSQDKSLPLNAYLVSYSDDGVVKYDIAQGTQVKIFDHYYDEYKNVISMKWTDGRVNPKMYNQAKKTKK